MKAAIILALLVNHGVPATDADKMVCIAQAESRLDEQAINKIHNRNGTKDYGLFQINDIWVGTCVDNPEDLLNPLVNIKCAVHVYKKQGLGAWSTYRKCKGEPDGQGV